MPDVALSTAEAAALAARLEASVGQAIFGQKALLAETLCCLLAGGHILLTGAPGLAKTTLVRVFARHLGLHFGRVQFTPDLLPTDILGTDILHMDPDSGRRTFEFAKGPIFTNLLLADEINRASPRTQSALLEAMQERAVTVSGKRHLLPEPFMVFATQNPFESEGTFPLPEAQLDRFLVHTLVDYPESAAEEQILLAHARGSLAGEQIHESAPEAERIEPAVMAALMARVRQTPVDQALLVGIRDLVRSTRPGDPLCPEAVRPLLWYGAGPRAGISLISMARAYALTVQSEVVRWEHVRRMVKPVLRHRLRLSAQGLQAGLSEDMVIDQLLARLEERQQNLLRGVG